MPQSHTVFLGSESFTQTLPIPHRLPLLKKEVDFGDASGLYCMDTSLLSQDCHGYKANPFSCSAH